MYRGLLRKTKKLKTKLRGFHDASSGTLLYASHVWTPSQTAVHDVRTWGNKRLRDACRMKWRRQEGRMRFFQRSADTIDRWHRNLKITRAFRRWLEAYFKSAWTLPRKKIAGRFLLRELLSTRSQRWFDSISDIPSKRRALDDCVQATSGKSTGWDSLLITSLGEDWLDMSLKCDRLARWMKIFDSFSRTSPISINCASCPRT